MINKLFNLDFNGTAIVTDDGRSVSYVELRRLTDEWSAKVPSRSLVFLLVGNNLDSLVAYVACLNHGIVPLMLDAKIDGQLLQRFIDVYHPDFIWRPTESGYVLEPRNTQNIQEDGSGFLYNPCVPWFESKKLHPDLALLLTTSGSTGSPKLVRQSYANIRANTQSIVEYLKLDSSEHPITTLPMNYTYGLSIINTHLAVGATILLTEKSIMQREFWNFFTEQGATSFGGVPYTYEMLDKSSIVAIASIGGIVAEKGQIAYAGTKAGLAASFKSIARELVGQGIRVNCVSPGMVDTPMTAMSNEEYLVQARASYPLGFAEVVDVANMVVFLLSTQSKWISGQNYIMDCAGTYNYRCGPHRIR